MIVDNSKIYEVPKPFTIGDVLKKIENPNCEALWKHIDLYHSRKGIHEISLGQIRITKIAFDENDMLQNPLVRKTLRRMGFIRKIKTYYPAGSIWQEKCSGDNHIKLCYKTGGKQGAFIRMYNGELVVYTKNNVYFDLHDWDRLNSREIAEEDIPQNILTQYEYMPSLCTGIVDKDHVKSNIVGNVVYFL